MNAIALHKYFLISIIAKRESLERQIALLKSVEQYHADQIDAIEKGTLTEDCVFPYGKDSGCEVAKIMEA